MRKHIGKTFSVAAAAVLCVTLAPFASAQDAPPPPAPEPPRFFDQKITGWVDVDTPEQKIDPESKTHKLTWEVSAMPQPNHDGVQQSIMTVAIPKKNNVKKIAIQNKEVTQTPDSVKQQLTKYREASLPLFEGEKQPIDIEKMRRVVNKNPLYMINNATNWEYWQHLGWHPEMWADQATDLREGLVRGEDGKAMKSPFGGYVYVVSTWKNGDKHFFLYKTIPENVVNSIDVESPKTQEQLINPDFEKKPAQAPLADSIPAGRLSYPALLEYASKETYGGTAPAPDLIQHDINQSKKLGEESYDQISKEFTSAVSDELGIDAPDLAEYLDYANSHARGMTVFTDPAYKIRKVKTIEKNSGEEKQFGDPIPEILANAGEMSAQIDNSDKDYTRIFFDTARGETNLTITAEVEKTDHEQTMPIQAFLSHLVERRPEQPVRIVDAGAYPFGRGYKDLRTTTRGPLVEQERPGDIFGNQQCFVTHRKTPTGAGMDIPLSPNGEKNTITPENRTIVGGAAVYESGLALAAVPELEDGCDQASVRIPAASAQPVAAPVEKHGVAWWVWAVGGFFALLIIGAIVRAMRNNDDEEEPDEEVVNTATAQPSKQLF